LDSSRNKQGMNVAASNHTNALLHSMKKGWQLYVLMLLPVLYIVIFKYVPMYGALIAFKDFVPSRGIMGSEWAGFHYFQRFFESYEFWRVMKNTIILSFYQLLVGFPFPILLALCLNDVKHAFFKKSVQMITYAPHFISVVVMVGIIFQVLDPRTGVVNSILQFFGMDSVNFLGNPQFFMSIYVWSGLWQNVGFSCIVYLAALSAIDPSLHEAAVMDGAGKIRRMRHIDFPGILPIAVILLILDTGHILDTGFEKVLLMQNPLNLSASEVIDTFVYKVGLASTVVNYSYSTAIGLFKSVISLVLILFVNRLAKKVGQEGLW